MNVLETSALILEKIVRSYSIKVDMAVIFNHIAEIKVNKTHSTHSKQVAQLNRKRARGKHTATSQEAGKEAIPKDRTTRLRSRRIETDSDRLLARPLWEYILVSAETIS